MRTEPAGMELELRDVARHYGSAAAVDGVSLAVGKGELVSLLGPSGCGKTTTLRIVAGFIEPTRGTVHLRGRDVTRVAPHQRDTGMVFQSYALFPHLTAAQNIAFGLKRRGIARAEVERRTLEMIALLKLGGLADRLPRQLSGGQQQRVAVGRALVINPAIVLLDEPFSNLDAQLRESTRLEMRRIQQELGLTVLFVTHDQAEAMSISDRVAIMNRGRIEQIGEARAVYTRPATRFVASFVGRANILDGRLVGRGPEGALYEAGSVRVLARPERETLETALVLRPEFIRLERPDGAPPGDNAALGSVRSVSYSGPVAHLEIALGDGRTLLVEGPGSLPVDFPPGTRVRARWRPEDVVLCEP